MVAGLEEWLQLQDASNTQGTLKDPNFDDGKWTVRRLLTLLGGSFVTLAGIFVGYVFGVTSMFVLFDPSHHLEGREHAPVWPFMYFPPKAIFILMMITTYGGAVAGTIPGILLMVLAIKYWRGRG